ncbi:carboxypeptidase regulatory-like domain-containing protein [Aetokthonos hydrillicola Thurmond2011]|jgi:hypothetical protein|uniref:Carboxypeptidase regulatory-like domain-containing protein n=1 Tax=Aetokthonos hydrillicola Thurmond2011 TaxID=2712845 RepID=A0AAP5MDL2_9CYAN|nr:carboxypeptidase regulatory-like domain-containing protein [Aetokthonos hydrillicola]MDR9899763.1 carboxypeptidase regulatory-like domain-containing protein [Aetokthonos hydrillicola Thurmond2011]
MSSSNADNAEVPSSSNNVYTRHEQFEGVTGLVTTRDGHPIVNAWIQAKSLDEPSNPIPEIAIITNEAGEYKWTLLPGKYKISVFIDNRKLATKLVTVKPGQAVTLDFNVSTQ